MLYLNGGSDIWFSQGVEVAECSPRSTVPCWSFPSFKKMKNRLVVRATCKAYFVSFSEHKSNVLEYGGVVGHRFEAATKYC